MTAYICRTCGVQYPPSAQPPAVCLICDDERQYVCDFVQLWTTLDELEREGHRNEIGEVERGLSSIRTEPHFGIGQRALLVQTPAGNVLWDCITFLDGATIDAVRALGGIAAIAISHPHFYGTVAEWSREFDAPFYAPEDDRAFVTYPGDHVRWWRGEIELAPGVALIQCGGHFEGSSAVHWRDGADGRGVLLTGDTIAVATDSRFVSFMRSYPNLIPVPAAAVEAIAAAVRPFRFERIYAGFDGAQVLGDANAAVERSAARYVRWVGGGPAA